MARRASTVTGSRQINSAYYPPGKTVERFHASDARRRVIIGPVRSGKSVGSCAEIIRRIMQQEPDNQGVRRQRWLVSRTVYSELEQTTWKTFEAWYGHLGVKRGSAPFTFEMKFPHPSADGTWVEAEIVFMALAAVEDTKRLLSLDLTSAYLNEMRDLPMQIVMTVDDRLGQYPSKAAGGPTWYGLIADTNPPDTDSWVYLAETEERHTKPEKWRGWEFYRQPGGLIKQNGIWVENPEAENIRNLNNQHYYLDNMAGRSDDHIAVYYGGEYGFINDGSQIVPEFSQQLHISATPLEFEPGQPIRVGMDFGGTPAAVFAQKIGRQWRVIEEYVTKPTESSSALSFGENVLKPRMQELKAKGFVFVITGDPGGKAAEQASGGDCFTVLRSIGIEASPSNTNSATIRHAIVSKLCSEMIMGRDPALVIDRRCRTLIKGYAEKYVFRTYNGGPHGMVKTTEVVKNHFSHVCEALQYAFLGAGEDLALKSASRLSPGPFEWTNYTDVA